MFYLAALHSAANLHAKHLSTCLAVRRCSIPSGPVIVNPGRNGLAVPARSLITERMTSLIRGPYSC